MENKELSRLQERLLVEYQASQDSAQHHDNLVWTTSGLIWGSSIVLLGFVLDYLSKQPNKLFILVLSILSILMYVALLIFACQFADIRKQKYDRCKEIEKVLSKEIEEEPNLTKEEKEKLKFKQHRSLEYKGIQHVFYKIINSVFIIFWIIVMKEVFCS